MSGQEPVRHRFLRGPVTRFIGGYKEGSFLTSFVFISSCEPKNLNPVETSFESVSIVLPHRRIAYDNIQDS